MNFSFFYGYPFRSNNSRIPRIWSSGAICLQFMANTEHRRSEFIYCRRRVLDDIICSGANSADSKGNLTMVEPHFRCTWSTIQRYRGRNEEFGILPMYGCETDDNDFGNIAWLMKNNTLIHDPKYKNLQQATFSQIGANYECNEVCMIANTCPAPNLVVFKQAEGVNYKNSIVVKKVTNDNEYGGYLKIFFSVVGILIVIFVCYTKIRPKNRVNPIVIEYDSTSVVR